MTPDGAGLRRWIVTVLGAGSVWILAGSCGGMGFPGMGSRALEMPAGIAASRLPDPGSRGAHLTAVYCSRCHGVPSPQRHSAQDWEVVARRMFRRMEHMDAMGGMMGRRMHGDIRAPSPEEETEILAYLQRHALAEADEARLPEAEGRGLFLQTCSRCHAVPSPGQHTPEDWPAVVERMRERMRQMEVPEIDASQAATITGYLQRAAEEAPRR